MNSQHFEQRVGVYVDVQNMYYSAKNLYKAKVNFKEILHTAVSGRVLVRDIAYVIKADIKEERNFFEALSKIGFEVKTKDLQTFVGGAKKGDWDIGIAMDTIELAPKLDTIVLVSGDGDFIPLVEYQRWGLGREVEVAAFSKTASGKLREATDRFTSIEEIPKILLKSSKATRTTRTPRKTAK